MTGIFDILDVLVQRARAGLERGRLPRGASLCQLLGRNVQLDRVLDSVDGDDISILDERDRSSDLRLWYHVSDAESVAPADEYCGMMSKEDL